jgi:hypothetical protein
MRSLYWRGTSCDLLEDNFASGLPIIIPDVKLQGKLFSHLSPLPCDWPKSTRRVQRLGTAVRLDLQCFMSSPGHLYPLRDSLIVPTVCLGSAHSI